MHETEAELAALQELLDASVERAGAFLKRSFQMPERSLRARDLAARLDGPLVVALATVTARGEPRVAPTDALFLHGAFHVPTVAESARARNLARTPAASLTWFEGIRVAVIAHGTAVALGAGDDGFAEADAAQLALGRESPTTWTGTPVYLRVAPTMLYTYAEDLGG